VAVQLQEAPVGRGGVGGGGAVHGAGGRGAAWRRGRPCGGAAAAAPHAVRGGAGGLAVLHAYPFRVPVRGVLPLAYVARAQGACWATPAAPPWRPRSATAWCRSGWMGRPRRDGRSRGSSASTSGRAWRANSASSGPTAPCSPSDASPSPSSCSSDRACPQYCLVATLLTSVPWPDVSVTDQDSGTANGFIVFFLVLGSFSY
jgi:hypothetical protein